MSRRPSLADMNEEILVKIFATVPKRDLASVFSSCKTFERVKNYVWQDHCSSIESTWKGSSDSFQKTASLPCKQKLVTRQWITFANKASEYAHAKEGVQEWLCASHMFFTLLCMFTQQPSYQGNPLSTHVAHLAHVLLKSELLRDFPDAIQDRAETTFACLQVANDFFYGSENSRDDCLDTLTNQRHALLCWLRGLLEQIPEYGFWFGFPYPFVSLFDFLCAIDMERAKVLSVPTHTVSNRERYLSYRMRCSELRVQEKRNVRQNYKVHARDSMRVWAEFFMTKSELFFDEESAIWKARLLFDYAVFLAMPFPVPVRGAACVFLGRLFHQDSFGNTEEVATRLPPGHVLGYSSHFKRGRFLFPEVEIRNAQESQEHDAYPCVPERTVLNACAWLLERMDPNDNYLPILNTRGRFDTDSWTDIDDASIERVRNYMKETWNQA